MLDYLGDFALIVIVLLFLIWIGAALWNVTGTGRAWDQIGAGPWALDRDRSERPAETAAERDADLQALIEARDARRAARGGTGSADGAAPETSPGPAGSDPALEAEIREHVVARNSRRVAAGKEPLDEDAEVARLLAGG